MVKRRLLWLLLCLAAGTAGIFASGTALANTDVTYAYYDVRGASNYMQVNVTTASGCIVKPTDEDVFFYDHLDATVPGTNAPDIRPVAAAVDDHNVDIKVDIGPFCEPMAVSLSVFAPVLSPEDIWFLDSDNSMSTLSDEAIGEGQSGETAAMSGSGKHGHNKRFKNLIFWKSKVVEVTQDFKAQLPSGLYVITLSATPSGGNHERFYRWVTLFIVP
ncbi:MAG TPA: hypothetical protein VMH06_06625 [Thermodesulfovibrionales bacterium]|nr:hypothetical protein [Thermodesulfovibrionales bacterium]